MESSTPTPIAKNTTNGTKRYGWLVSSVKPVRKGAIKRIRDEEVEIPEAMPEEPLPYVVDVIFSVTRLLTTGLNTDDYETLDVFAPEVRSWR